jgi:predicted DNA-binding antitoxin AbrB/MazE fold protein
MVRRVDAIFTQGTLHPVEPLTLPEGTRVHLSVALLDSDDLAADAIAELAGKDTSFDFLNDPREDVYNESDGEAV